MHPKLINFLGFCLGLFLIFLSWCAIKAAILIDSLNETTQATKSIITQAKPKIDKTLSSFQSTTNKIDSFITPERLKYLDEAARAQIDGTNQATQGAAGVTLATITTLEEFVQPAISDFRSEGKETFGEIKTQIKELQKLTQELTHQVKQNGDSINQLIVHSDQEVTEILQEAKQSAKSIKLITSDPKILEIVSNLNDSSRSLTDSSANIEITTQEIADLSKYLIEPIVRPKPKKGIAKVLSPLYTIFKFINGTGNILFLVNKIGGQ